jgi:hypothetical protein
MGMKLSHMVRASGLLVYLLVGCTDSVLPTEEVAEGSYALVSVDGGSLPVTVFVKVGFGWSDVIGGTLELGADKSFTLTIERVLHYTGTSDHQTVEERDDTVQFSGTFSTVRGAVILQFEYEYGNTEDIVAPVHANVMTLDAHGHTYRLLAQ